MDISTQELDNGATRVDLQGELDIAGSAEADPVFERLALSANGILVDMSGVAFLASIGIRTLVMAAKTLSQRNHALVILAPQDAVAQVLRTSGIDQVIPVHEDEASALAALA